MGLGWMGWMGWMGLDLRVGGGIEHLTVLIMRHTFPSKPRLFRVQDCPTPVTSSEDHYLCGEKKTQIVKYNVKQLQVDFYLCHRRLNVCYRGGEVEGKLPAGERTKKVQHGLEWRKTRDRAAKGM